MAERAPQELQEVGAVRAGESGDVGERDRRGLFGAVDERALLWSQQGGALLARPAPGLTEDPPSQPYVLGGVTELTGAADRAAVCRGGGPGARVQSYGRTVVRARGASSGKWAAT
ncbi:hypothetical protein [Streptomyces sp. V4I2]|uniref:hypothetical protein n=1 Tax=Streptomyces sp. V4I2 TaxID=3042280 RepID=UPI00278A0B97|nr:hypothetical protein [Streptomyces sp. V4I2]MDQ1047882.1 hypothetical protein [Streptomyces sp. V4I2]